jgi:hypothetical protein
VVAGKLRGDAGDLEQAGGFNEQAPSIDLEVVVIGTAIVWRYAPRPPTRSR